MVFVVLVSTLLSVLLVFWYWQQISIKTNSQVLVQRDEIAASLQESLIEPLRFHNVKDIGRVLSAYAGRSLEWAVLFDSSNVPLYTVGNVPDIAIINHTFSELNLENDTFENIFEIKDGDNVLGRISFGLKLRTYREQQHQEKLNLVSITIFAFLTMILLLGFYAQYLVGRINILNKTILDFNPLKSAKPSLENPGDELDNIYAVFSKTAIHLQEAQLKLAERTKAEAMATLASQVAHDIRSPLAALNMVASTLVDAPEEKRLLIRNAIQRINDIANDLLVKGKQIAGLPALGVAGSAQEKNEVILLPAFIDSLVSEKRIQFRDQINVRIESDFQNSFGAFVMADGKEIMRLLSNLINNSIEAFEGNNGEVIVAVRTHQENIQLTLKDNGVGIPPEVLKRLGEPGVTFGKEGAESGSGLGVYHAKKSIEAIGGRFIMSSVVGAGTLTEILLPRGATPSWFLESIQLRPGMDIICLDDDSTIHQIWKGRLESLQAFQQNIVVHNFTSASEFKKFMRSRGTSHENSMYLIDYELLGQSTNGLSVIEELGLRENVVLVTSRYEETEIKAKCEFLKIKLLPKSLAGFVPIEIKTKKIKEYYDVILIDDDQLIQLIWQSTAIKKEKKFIGFYAFDEFLKRADEFDFTSPIYIDSNLKDGVKGEEVSKNIFEIGFENIYLCTGHELSHFSKMSHIKQVVGKDPLF